MRAGRYPRIRSITIQQIYEALLSVRAATTFATCQHLHDFMFHDFMYYIVLYKFPFPFAPSQLYQHQRRSSSMTDVDPSLH
mmetsp:Transcript_2732/g.3893  ORF Transcript_2732/g.3893 Transcript_2732/m.3893 type:complete len:81 (+) Transcript_2732:28-270(+)